MAINLTDDSEKYDDIYRHVGHKVEVVGYGLGAGTTHPANVAIECMDCDEVLVDQDLPEDEE